MQYVQHANEKKSVQIMNVDMHVLSHTQYCSNISKLTVLVHSLISISLLIQVLVIKNSPELAESACTCTHVALISYHSSREEP